MRALVLEVWMRSVFGFSESFMLWLLHWVLVYWVPFIVSINIRINVLCHWRMVVLSLLGCHKHWYLVFSMPSTHANNNIFGWHFFNPKPILTHSNLIHANSNPRLGTGRWVQLARLKIQQRPNKGEPTHGAKLNLPQITFCCSIYHSSATKRKLVILLSSLSNHIPTYLTFL